MKLYHTTVDQKLVPFRSHLRRNMSVDLQGGYGCDHSLNLDSWRFGYEQRDGDYRTMDTASFIL